MLSSPGQVDFIDSTAAYYLSTPSQTNGKQTPRHSILSTYFPSTAASKTAKTSIKPKPAITTKQSPSATSSEIDLFDNLATDYLFMPSKADRKMSAPRKESQTSKTESRRLSDTAYEPSARMSSEIDIFEYQVAGYLSMPLGQSYKTSPPRSLAATTSNGSSKSSSSTPSLWSKAKSKLHRKHSSSHQELASDEAEFEKSKEKEIKKEERDKDYKELGLEEKVKFGTKGGMNMGSL